MADDAVGTLADDPGAGVAARGIEVGRGYTYPSAAEGGLSSGSARVDSELDTESAVGWLAR